MAHRQCTHENNSIIDKPEQNSTVHARLYINYCPSKSDAYNNSFFQHILKVLCAMLQVTPSCINPMEDGNQYFQIFFQYSNSIHYLSENSSMR